MTENNEEVVEALMGCSRDSASFLVFLSPEVVAFD